MTRGVAATVDDVCAWRGSDFPDTASFSIDVSPDQIADLGQCCQQIEAAGRACDITTAADFQLTTWADILANLQFELKSGRGFALIRGLPFAGWTKQRAKLACWGIGLMLGTHVSQTIQGARICDVIDVTKGEASPRQYRTNRELSLHTDPASDLIGLACLQPAKAGGESILASATRIYNEMLERRPDLLAVLKEGFFVHRFGEGLPQDGPVTRYKVPVLADLDGTVSCRYVRPTIIAGHKEAGVPLTATQLEAMDMFDAIAGLPENHVSFRLETGDIVLVNNLSVLHARTEFTDFADPNLPRHLLRLWLEAPSGFRAYPAAMNYFNDGRCGIPVQQGREVAYDVTGLPDIRGFRHARGTSTAQ